MSTKPSEVNLPIMPEYRFANDEVDNFNRAVALLGLCKTAISNTFIAHQLKISLEEAGTYLERMTAAELIGPKNLVTQLDSELADWREKTVDQIPTLPPQPAKTT